MLFLVVVIATAVASVPPDGAVVIATVGVLVNPDPSLLRNIFWIYPVPTDAVAEAPEPVENIVRSRM